MTNDSIHLTAIHPHPPDKTKNGSVQLGCMAML